jgi:hypothetical protein
VGAAFYPRCHRAFSPIENGRLIGGGRRINRHHAHSPIVQRQVKRDVLACTDVVCDRSGRRMNSGSHQPQRISGWQNIAYTAR